MVHCCVPFCKSSKKKYADLSFHEFPSNLDLRNKWLKVISRKDFTVNDKSASSVVCSRHFKTEDYLQGKKRKCLRSDVVPSIFENYPSYMVPKSAKCRLVPKRCRLGENVPNNKSMPKKSRRQECLVKMEFQEEMCSETDESVDLELQPSKTQINRKSDPALIEKEHESYVEEHKSQFNALIQNIQQRVLSAEHIKKESTTEGTSNITDEFGNVIGETTLRVGNAENLGEINIKKEIDDTDEPVIVKEEPPDSDSESLLQNVYINQDDEVSSKSAVAHNELDTDGVKTPKLQFRIKKDVPSVKIKEEPLLLLEQTTDRDLAVDNSSLEDFQTGKMSINKFHKKKYARRLSTEEKNSQRKK